MNQAIAKIKLARYNFFLALALDMITDAFRLMVLHATSTKENESVFSVHQEKEIYGYLRIVIKKIE